jgi:hypothetical protein
MNPPDAFAKLFGDEHMRILRVLLSQLSETDLDIAHGQLEYELAARADQDNNALRLFLTTLSNQELLEVQTEVQANLKITEQTRRAERRRRRRR